MASTSSAGHSTQPTSPSRSALPETTAYYQHSIEAASQHSHFDERQSQPAGNVRRQRSTRSQGSVSSAGLALPVDDEIAEGLGEEVNAAAGPSAGVADGDSSIDDDGFLPARDKTRTHSILPPSAFFAPKRPPQSHSQTALPPRINHNASEDHPNLDVGPLFRRGEPTPLDSSGKERGVSMRGRDVSLDAASSLALGSRSSSDGQGRSSAAAPAMQDKSGVGAYRQVVLKNQASGDYLLGESKATKLPASQSKQSIVKQSFSKPSEQGRQKRLRRYKAHQGANRFYVCGFIMTSDDNPLPFIMSLVVMVVLPVLWFIFVAPFTWHHISPAPVIIFAYVWAISASSMCVTAWRDPGVLPRDLDPDPPCTAGEDGKQLSVKDRLAIPLPRIIRVRNGTDLKVKWCDTCGTYRPPRSSHCRVCDNCVENIDHHCTYLNTCIGRRNYFSFFAFLLTALLACFLSIAFSVLHIYYLTRPLNYALPRGGFGQGKDFGQALKATPLSAVIFLLSIAVVLPVMVLFGYHVRLVCINRTTVEQIRINATSAYSEKPSYDDDVDTGSPSDPKWSCLNIGKPGKDPNPFAHRTIFRNIKTALLRPMAAHSWIDRYHYQRPDNRSINPAHRHD